MRRIRGIIFDFDGLIIDTESARYHTWKRIFDFYNIAFPFSLIESIFGIEQEASPMVPYLESRLGYPLDAKQINLQVKECFASILENIGMRPGVAEYLESARQMGLAMTMASNARARQIMPLIEKAGIRHYFQNILTIEDVKQPKPDPEMFNLALHRMGLRADEVIAFDDSFIGARAARAAGIFCVLVPNELTRHFDLGGADWILSSMAKKSLDQLLLEISAAG